MRVCAATYATPHTPQHARPRRAGRVCRDARGSHRAESGGAQARTTRSSGRGLRLSAAQRGAPIRPLPFIERGATARRTGSVDSALRPPSSSGHTPSSTADCLRRPGSAPAGRRHARTRRTVWGRPFSPCAPLVAHPVALPAPHPPPHPPLLAPPTPNQDLALPHPLTAPR